MSDPNVLWFDEVCMDDVDRVGGKNASLGEMVRELSAAGVTVPQGFATTAAAYREFISSNKLEGRIVQLLNDINVDDLSSLSSIGGKIRELIVGADLPDGLVSAVGEAYGQLAAEKIAVAVRSSATAEDLPDASFAGQQETFLNVRGVDDLLEKIRQAYASLFTDRAIIYREIHHYDHMKVALSAGVQQMVRADSGSSGVAFTIDTESGFDQVVFITAAWGLGETVVQGIVNPDEFFVYKPALGDRKTAILMRTLGEKRQKMVYVQEGVVHGTGLVDVIADDRIRFSLSDNDVEEIARQAMLIEDHYGQAMDIEWAKDGEENKVYILQARPETVQSRRDNRLIERYALEQRPDPIVSGRAVGRKIGCGRARVVTDINNLHVFQEGEVLVADQTEPDWGPAMKRASAVITNKGGRACHAAIVAREMGIPAIVGCGDATDRLTDGEDVTVSCAEGEAGFAYPGKLRYRIDSIHVDSMPSVPVEIMMNLANPWQAFEFSQIPNSGVGLARMEFIINHMIGIHPRAALEFENLPSATRREIEQQCRGYSDPESYYVSRLAQGVAMLSAAFAPKPVIVRTSDFKSNEYAHLIGGELFEPAEENPMIGYRGAARYLSPEFNACFELECRAIKQVREDMGLTNLDVMIPFTRTTEEAKQVVKLLADNGLRRGDKGLRLIMMCEIPSNVVLADEFLEFFDGFSIGSNDLTQLTLGVDRNSDLLAGLFNERDPAVMKLMQSAIEACKRKGKYIGICGQAPSDYPEVARWLADAGIDSLSLNPDCVISTWLALGSPDRHAASHATVTSGDRYTS